MARTGQDPRSGRRPGATPGFPLAALLLLTLGLTAAAAVLAVVDSLLVAALPYEDAGRLVAFQGTFTDNKGQVTPWDMSEMDFADWRRQNRVFTAASVHGSIAFNLEKGRQSERLWGELVNDSYFPLLGLKPTLGRFFTVEEDTRPLEKYVVVLGYDLWRRAFGADRGVVGRPLRLNGGVYQIVGVGPKEFRGLSDQADLWVPSMLPPIRDYLTVRRERWITSAVARLQPGVTIGQAQQQMNHITADLARQFPNMNQGIGVTLTPLREGWVGELRHGLLRLALGAGLLLLFAGFDARLLLGGRGWSLGRSLLTGVLALLLAGCALRLLIPRSGLGLPSFFHLSLGPLAIAGTLVFALLCGLALGRGGAPRSPGGRRLQALVVLLQVGFALYLLADAGRAARGYRQLIGGDLGFRAGDVLTFRMDLKGPQYAENEPVSKLLRERYLPRIAAVPGVEQVAISNPTMPTDGLAGGYITIDDHASDSPDGTYIILWHSVSPGYFKTLGIPLLAGRDLTARDTDSNVVLVSKAAAEQHWPGKNPLGHRLKQDARAVASEPWMTVVGVVGEVRHEGIQSDHAPAPDMYMSVLQFPLRLPMTMNFLVHPKPGTAPAGLRRALRTEMLAIDPELPAYDFKTLQERLDQQIEAPRFQVLLAALLAGLALFLAAVGTYGFWRGRFASPAPAPPAY
jgi:putative ABC transport system permease protein